MDIHIHRNEIKKSRLFLAAQLNINIFVQSNYDFN